MIVPPPLDRDLVADRRRSVDELVSLAMGDPLGQLLGERYLRHVVRVLRGEAVLRTPSY